MRAASIDKEVRELKALVDTFDKNGQAKEILVIFRAIRMLQEQQAAIAVSQKTAIDLRPSKIEENARMAKIARAYQKVRRSTRGLGEALGNESSNGPGNDLLDDFHAEVDKLIAKS